MEPSLRAGGPTREIPPLEQLDSTLARAADVHAFLVSAALYWATVREIVNHVPKPDLRPPFADYETAAMTAKTAREHIEHLNERIVHGRSGERLGGAMPADVFREAVGAFDGERMMFGDESFPLGDMLEAIRASSSAIAPRLAEATAPNLQVRVTAPESDPPSEAD